MIPPKRRVTNEDFRELSRFFANPHPLFETAYIALWSEDHNVIMRNTCNLLGVQVADEIYAGEIVGAVTRNERLLAILKAWASASRIDMSVTSITFDMLRKVDIVTTKTEKTLSNLNVSDPIALVAMNLILQENMVLALAVAWRVISGDKEFC